MLNLWSSSWECSFLCETTCCQLQSSDAEPAQRSDHVTWLPWHCERLDSDRRDHRQPCSDVWRFEIYDRSRTQTHSPGPRTASRSARLSMPVKQLRQTVTANDVFETFTLCLRKFNIIFQCQSVHASQCWRKISRISYMYSETKCVSIYKNRTLCLFDRLRVGKPNGRNASQNADLEFGWNATDWIDNHMSDFHEIFRVLGSSLGYPV